MSSAHKPVVSPEDLAATLRQLRRAAGNPTLRTLGSQIGVSHSTIADAFRGVRLPSRTVIEGLIKFLPVEGDDAALLREQWTAALTSLEETPVNRPDDIFVQNYLRLIRAFSEQIRLPSANLGKRGKLASLYVEQKVSNTQSGECIELRQLDNAIGRAVLLGNPGSGKSTACAALASWHTSDTSQLVPFLVTIRDFISVIPPERSIVRYIEHSTETLLQIAPPDGFIPRLFADGNALVIFDGLDEISTEAARMFTSVVEIFCNEFPEVRVLVTSRPVGYAQAPLDPEVFELYKLEEFTQEQASEYVRRWLALDSNVSDDERASLERRWASESSLAPDLWANPLLLSLAAQLYTQSLSFPRRPVDVARSMFDFLIFRWDSLRGINAGDLSPAHIEAISKHLAFYMLTKDKNALRESEILRELIASGSANQIETTAQVQDYIRVSRNRSWILSEVGVSPDGESIFSFTHRTFMEYLSAAYLAETPNAAELIANQAQINRSAWRNVLEYMTELLAEYDPPRANKFLEEVAVQVKHLRPEASGELVQYLAERGTTDGNV